MADSQSPERTPSKAIFVTAPKDGANNNSNGGFGEGEGTQHNMSSHPGTANFVQHQSETEYLIDPETSVGMHILKPKAGDTVVRPASSGIVGMPGKTRFFTEQEKHLLLLGT